MKLSEQYARKINTLNELGIEKVKVPKKKTGGKPQDDKTGTDEESWGNIVGDLSSEYPVTTFLLGATVAGLFGKYAAMPAYRTFLAPGKPLSFGDWYKRFKIIKNNRKNQLPPHKSESVWRHILNVATQKEVHTATDIYNKVKAGKFTPKQGIDELDQIYGGNISSTQRIQMYDNLKAMAPKPTVTATGKTTGKTTGKVGGTIKNKLTTDQFNSLTEPQRAAWGKNPDLTYDELKLIGTPAGKKAEADAVKQRMSSLGLSTPTGL